MRNKFVFLMAILSFLLILSPLSASAKEIDLSSSNFTIGGSTPYASVTLIPDISTANKIDFTITLLNGLAGNGTTIGEFGFNTDSGLIYNDFSGEPTQWTQLDLNAQMDGFGRFSYVIGPPKNGQSYRVSGDQISFSIVDISAVSKFITNATDHTFALEVFPASGGTGYIGDGPAPTPTPEPATMLLFGTGLLGLAGLRKKFKR